MALLVSESDGKCAFETIFNFGDSNSDTGGFCAAFPPQPSPNGMTYTLRDQLVALVMEGYTLVFLVYTGLSLTSASYLVDRFLSVPLEKKS